MSRAWVPGVGLCRRKFLALSAAGLAGLAGCKTTEAEKVQIQRSQIGDEPTELDASTTVGSKTTIGNTDSILVSGVGLVFGLPGTGSSSPPGGWRAMLEESLKKQRGMGNLKQLLDDPAKTTSVVLVSALIPPGARANDPIDVQITLPDDSKTTSLKGGRLWACELYNTDTTGNLRSLAREGVPAAPSGQLRKGDLWAKAEGVVLAGQFIPGNGRAEPETDADGQPVFKVGKIWGGARVVKPRQYYILVNPGNPAAMAASIAERLNSTFHATSEPNLKVAEAKTRELILVNVPVAYRNNHYRFLLVARQVPLLPAGPDSLYRKRLEAELLDARTTLAAAVKLEALGTSSLRALRVGLNEPSPWVRFASAEALTYLGQTDGAAELARLSEDHPALRAPALKALAAMDDSACTDRLVDLAGSHDPALRYGAFLALRMADENHPAARGVEVKRSFYIHQLAPGSGGMVHLTSDRRCEIVLFGDAPKFTRPFTLPVGSEFTVHVPADGGEPTVTRIVTVKNGAEPKKVPCKSTALAHALLAIGELGGGYAEAVELIRRADRAQVLSAPVVVDAIPAELNIRQLSQFAASDPTLTRANMAIARAGVVRPDMEAAGFDLPPVEPEPAAQVPPPPPRPPLNRNPGRLFGPKRDDPPAEPGVLPAGGGQ